MSVVLDQEGLASQAVNILIKYFKTYKDGVGSQSLSSSSSDTYPPDVLELLSTVVINAIKSHVSAFSDRTTLLEVRKVLLCVLCSDNCSSCTEDGRMCMNTIFLFHTTSLSISSLFQAT
jgi:hypothetical protein